MDLHIDAILADLDNVTTTTEEKAVPSDQATESNTRQAGEHHAEDREKISDELIHKVSFSPDPVQSNSSTEPNVELPDTEDELSARIDVKATLPSSHEPIKTMYGMGIKGNGKDDPDDQLLRLLCEENAAWTEDLDDDFASSALTQPEN